MPRLHPAVVARGALSLLLLALGTGALSQRGAALAQAEVPATQASERRAVVETPYLRLAVDAARPSLELLGYAPAGDRQYGGSLGTLYDEALLDATHLRSDRHDHDGAQLSRIDGPANTVVRLEGINVGPAANSGWTITISHAEPRVQIVRQTIATPDAKLRGTGLAVTGPAVPEGTDPASLAHLVDGLTYRAEVGPPSLERPGRSFGVLAVNNPELSFSVTTDRPDQVTARQRDGELTIGFLQRAAPGKPSELLTENVTLRFGWDNDYLTARSDADPELEARLLAAGYYGNAVLSPLLGPVLSASMRDYRGSVWSRDFDYAVQGYAYVLEDLRAFTNTLVQFLERIDRHGVAPEYVLLNGEHGNRESWDSMANVIQASYTIVARTGDPGLYRDHRDALWRSLDWIRKLDTDDDGLPDRDIFPFGYTDTVENSPLHTYAIAKFYAAFLAMAELEELTGKDGRDLRGYAQKMKEAFQRPVAEGGYWDAEAGHPIAWKRASGQIYREFETFGVYEAIRVGLLDRPEQLESVGQFLDANHGAFLNGNGYPERLIIGGYDLAVRKPEVPLDKIWIMDCNAPWITGLSVPARVRLGRIEDAREMLRVYAESADRPTPHAEFGAGPPARYGPGETQDGGRLWDNWSWFSALYGSHFGLTMTPRALEIQPSPLAPDLARRATGIPYQGARVRLELRDDGYLVGADKPVEVVLRPPVGFRAVDVNADGRAEPARSLRLQPGADYVIRAYR